MGIKRFWGHRGPQMARKMKIVLAVGKIILLLGSITILARMMEERSARTFADADQEDTAATGSFTAEGPGTAEDPVAATGSDEEKDPVAQGDLAVTEGPAADRETDKGYRDMTYLTMYGADYTYDHRIESYLLIGTDHSGREDGRGDRYQGSMADFLALLVLDKTDEKYSLIHLNRDTVTKIQLLLEDDSVGEYRDMQLCTAHWYGSSREVSCENTVEAVSAMLGELPVDGYYSLPMDEIPSLNSVVGGVTVTVEDDFSSTDPSLEMGKTVTLSDEQAFHYVRDRMDVGDGGNRSRMRRQRQYLKGFEEKAKEQAKEDPQLAAEIYQGFQQMAVTDLNGNQVSKIANLLVKYEDGGHYEFEGKTEEGDILGDGMDHAMFFPDKASVIEVMTEAYSLQKED